jgi:hypothetical protein
MHTRIYFAANKVFRSDDRGNTWKVISGDLTRQIDRNQLEVMGKIWPMDAVAKNASTSPYGTIVALDESPLLEDMLYAGTDDGLIQVTENGGKNWRRIERFPGVPERTYVNDIIASHHDRNTVYAAFNNHKNGDFKPYILKSTDAGKSWVSLSADLPERGSVYALAEDHVNESLLFAGTEFGVFTSLDGGKSWKQLKSGLPTIAVRDLAIQKRENDLVLATFGRGIFILDDYSPLRTLSQDTLVKEGHIFPVKDALMFMEKTPLGTLGSRSKGFQGENYFTVPNPPVAAVFTYYLKESIQTLEEKREAEEKEKAKDGQPVYYPSYEQLKAEQEEPEPYLIFTILDEDDQAVRHLRTPAGKGLQRINWDLKYPALTPTSTRDADPSSTGPSSTFVLPGTYKVFMSKWVSGKETRLTDPAAFEVKMLNNTTLPAEDKAALAEFQRKVRKLNHSVSAAANVVRDLDERVTHYKAALKNITVPHQELYTQITALEEELAKIQRQMFGDSLKRQLDMDAEPGIARRVGSIIYEQWNSTSAPTQTQKDNYRITEELFTPIYKQLKEILEQDIKDIEQKLNDIGAPYTPGRLPDWK